MKIFIFTTLIYILNIFNCFKCDSDWPKICPEIVPRSKWGARSALQVDYSIIPLKYVIIHHTVSGECSSIKNCGSIIKNIQDYHMETLEFNDIGYNFLIGGDGRVYEGAGWHKVGAHTRGYNTKSLGIAFIGNFTDKKPTDKQLKAGKDLLQCGIQLGELKDTFKLFGGRQVISTASPGLRLYNEIKKWPNYAENV